MESTLFSLEISSAKEISPLLLNLTSGKFSGHGQKAARFSIKTTHEWVPTPFSNTDLCHPIALSTPVIHTDGILKSFHSIQWFS